MLALVHEALFSHSCIMLVGAVKVQSIFQPDAGRGGTEEGKGLPSVTLQVASRPQTPVRVLNSEVKFFLVPHYQNTLGFDYSPDSVISWFG